MQLTTPELKEYDSVFPGENWFLYWKTSPSLWATKLHEHQGTGPLFIPIYWGIHNEYAEQYDFGTYKPETDLARLATVAAEAGKKLVMIIPIGPTPFLPNGGLPPYLARSFSMYRDGLAMSVIDSENRLNKIYSMFDPKVFQAYRKFTWQLGQYLTRHGVEWEVYGGLFGHLDQGKFCSYLRDNSPTFEAGFNRYLKQLQSSEPQKIEQLQSDPSREEALKEEFYQQIQSLYEQAAYEAMSASWGKVINFAFLGGRPQDIFSRTSELWDHEFNFFHPLFEMVSIGVLPSSILLGPEFKRGVLNKCLRDQVSPALINASMDNSVQNDHGFMPLVFFWLNNGADGDQVTSITEKIGLTQFINRDFRWMSRRFTEFGFDESEVSGIYFFFGQSMRQSDLNTAIKLFLNGATVLLDNHGLSAEGQRKLHQFVTENAFPSEEVKFKCTLKRYKLGEGNFIVYDHAPILEFAPTQRVNFWTTLTNFLKIKHIKLEIDEDIYFFWRNRASNTYELNYEEIRRLSVYNPTSYKKRVQINSTNNFAFLKSLDQIRCDVKSIPVGITLDLMPGGSVSLDFGHYE